MGNYRCLLWWMSLSTTPTRISLPEYIRQVQEYKRPSKYTIDTFTDAIIHSGLEDIPTDQDGLNELWKYLNERFDSGKTTRGYMKNFLSLVKAALKFNAVAWLQDINYNILSLKLVKSKPEPKLAYEDSDVQELLRAVQFDIPVWNSLILMSQAGLRIGACRGLKFSDFHKVPEVPGVLVFEVRSKGKKYDTCISEYAFNLLRRRGNRDVIVEYDNENIAEFGDAIRSRLYLKLQAENKLGLAKGKSMLHGLRKWSAGMMAMSGTPTEDVGRLLGHKIYNGNKITNKSYVTANEYTRNWRKYLATVYSKTALMSWKYLSPATNEIIVGANKE